MHSKLHLLLANISKQHRPISPQSLQRLDKDNRTVVVDAFRWDYADTHTTTKTHSSPSLRFGETAVSLLTSLPPESSYGTKLGLERSTSKSTSGSLVTRTSARSQTPRGGSLSFVSRIKGRKRFRCPKRSISCIQPPAHLVVSSGVGGTE
jgi:hypothetical protein